MTVIKVEHTHKAETEFLLETVLSCSCFSSWTAYHVALWQDGEYNSMGYPAAYWEHGWQVFWADEEDAEPFDPYQSLDDAWKILKEASLDPTKAFGTYPHWSKCQVEELCTIICEAVLRAYHYRGEQDEDRE